MRTLQIADLFCGAGGTSTGAVEAGRRLGFDVQLTAINHWNVAIATHTKNHPSARHLCTSLDNINPRDLFKPGELNVLWASPECTQHSNARQGQEINDQSRSTAFCVVRWAEALLPQVVLIENVPEFRNWAPLIQVVRTVKVNVPKVSYRQWRRKRLSDTKRTRPADVTRAQWKKTVKMEPRKVSKRIMLPDPKRKGEIFRAWIAMFEAIGYRVDYRVLCAADYGDPTTRERLFIQCVRGKRKICWPDPTRAEKPELDLFGKTLRPWRTARKNVIDWTIPGTSIFDRKKPLADKTLNRIWEGLQKFGLKVTSEAFSPVRKEAKVKCKSCGWSVKGVRSTPECPSCGAEWGVSTSYHHTDKVPTFEEWYADTKTHGGSREEYDRIYPHDKPSVGPFLVCMEHGGTVRDANRPVPTVTTAKGGAIGIAEPFLVNMKGESDAADINLPTPTLTAHAPHLYLAEPYLVQVAHGNGNDPKADARRAKSVDAPLSTVCGTRGEIAVIQPSLLPQHGGGALRPVDQPVPTVATGGAIGLIEPFIVEYYGTGGAQSVDRPVGTATTKPRFGLVRPTVIIQGKQYLLDIRFRMLQPHELAAAQGFRRDYHFTGNKTEQVKQIGNAVPRRLARAIVAAAWSQVSDVSYLDTDDDESELAA